MVYLDVLGRSELAVKVVVGCEMWRSKMKVEDRILRLLRKQCEMKTYSPDSSPRCLHGSRRDSQPRIDDGGFRVFLDHHDHDLDRDQAIILRCQYWEPGGREVVLHKQRGNSIRSNPSNRVK